MNLGIGLCIRKVADLEPKPDLLVSVSIPDTREAETKFIAIYDSLPEEG